LCLSDGNDVVEVPPCSTIERQRRDEAECFFVSFKNYVQVHTFHFSKYVVIASSPSGEPSRKHLTNVELLVFGKMETCATNVHKELPYRVNLEVYLRVSVDNLAQELPDFRTVNFNVACC
jgi:hypothetical protein